MRSQDFYQDLFLFVRVKNKPSYFSENEIDPKYDILLQKLVDKMSTWYIKYDELGHEIECNIMISQSARLLYKEWHDKLEDEIFVKSHNSRSSKIKAIALRICLLLHCVNAIINNLDEMNDITEEIMKNAILLADWIRMHQEQCLPMFYCKNNVKQPTPLDLAIMESVVEMKDIVFSKGKISNTELCGAVRKKDGMSKVSNEEIGIAADKLGLLPYKSGERGRRVSEKNFHDFEAALSVPTVQRLDFRTSENVPSGQLRTDDEFINKLPREIFATQIPSFSKEEEAVFEKIAHDAFNGLSC